MKKFASSLLLLVVLGFLSLASTAQARQYPYTDFGIYRNDGSGSKLVIIAHDGTRIIDFDQIKRDNRAAHWVKVEDNRVCKPKNPPNYWPKSCYKYKGTIAIFYDPDKNVYRYSWIEGGKYEWEDNKDHGGRH